jgi:hypothetical protein
MLINLLNNDLLFPLLDPRHLGNLRLVNRAFAACINKDVRDKSVAAALAKYRHMIILSEDTVRIHSSLGKTVIDLTLPTGKINKRLNADLSMRFEGRVYHGKTLYWQCEMDGEKVNLSPYIFHAKSPNLLKAKGVFIAGMVMEGNGIYIRVVVDEKNGVGRIFTLRFDQ